MEGWKLERSWYCYVNMRRQTFEYFLESNLYRLYVPNKSQKSMKMSIILYAKIIMKNNLSTINEHRQKSIIDENTEQTWEEISLIL